MRQLQVAEMQAVIFGNGNAETNAPFAFNRRQVGLLEDDFFEYTDTQRWTKACTNSGTVAASDAHGGVLVLTCDGADNDSALIASTNEIVKPVLGKRIFFQARIKYTEAAIDDANFYVGIADVSTASILGDDAAGPPASYGGIGFYKIDGGTTILVETSNAATQTNKATAETAPTRRSGEYMDLAFRVERWNAAGAVAYVDFFVNGECVSHNVALTLSGLGEMHVVVAIKNGGANAETMYLDFVQLAFDR